MRKFLQKGLIVLLFVGVLYAQLPYPLQQYKQLLKRGGVPASAPSPGGVVQYSSPQIYSQPESLQVPVQREQLPEEKIQPEDTLPYFDEPVVVAGETI